VSRVLYEYVRDFSDPPNALHACEALGVSRSGYWAWQQAKPDSSDELVGEIRRIASEFCGYGYRRVTAELKRRNLNANHKRVLSVMRQNGLTCRRKRFRVVTTDSNHSYKTYPNLAREMVLTGVNQLWVSDIPYVRIPNDFAYLAVVMDRFSRRCIGWALSKSIDAELSLDALHSAFATRKGIDLSGCGHHSDQGVQYASHKYVDALVQRGMQVSMSRKGNPYDNAFAESFMKTLKAEEVYLSEYESFADARHNIGRFIEEVYNEKRLHSSIGYVPPMEFEQALLREGKS